MAMSKFFNLPLNYLLLCLRTTLIAFVSKVKKMDKVDGTDAEKSEWIKLEFLIDPDNPVSNYSLQPTVFYLQGWMPRGLDQVGDGLL
jgi:hypothetical protein